MCIFIPMFVKRQWQSMMKANNRCECLANRISGIQIKDRQRIIEFQIDVEIKYNINLNLAVMFFGRLIKYLSIFKCTLIPLVGVYYIPCSSLMCRKLFAVIAVDVCLNASVRGRHLKMQSIDERCSPFSECSCLPNSVFAKPFFFV